MTEKKELRTIGISRKKDPKTGLTAQQEKFCQEYVQGGKTFEAYREAYPRSREWKDDSVYAASSALLDKPEIQARLNTLMIDNNKRYKISTNKVITEIVRMYETCNTEKERQTAFKCINLLARIVGLDSQNININNIQINNSVSIDNYLKLD